MTQELNINEGLGRGREDDEYHVPDPATTHKITHKVSHPNVEGGKEHSRTVTISNSTKTTDQAKKMARAHLEKQGYKIHEETVTEGAYEKAEENKRSADAAKKQGDMFAHHLHMADYHDNLAQWHDEKGRHSTADQHASKAASHHEHAMKLKEEVAANNVGDGKIAGTQGDAGKKPVMTKKLLKRQTFKEFLDIDEAAVDGKGHKSSTGGLTQKGRDYYNNKTGGNLQAPVTTKPSKLDPDSKAAKRRKSFCARMGGMPGPMKDEKGRPTRKALALRKWNC